MKLGMKLHRWLLSASLLWGLAAGVLTPQGASGSAAERPPLPEALGYVSDHAGALDRDWRERIRSVCQDLERKTGVEMVVVTVSTLQPYSTATDYAAALYQRWGIGTAQRDHGVLLLAAIQERQAAITVGRALAAKLTPSFVQSIGHQYVTAAFRSSHFGEGLYRASVALAASLQEIQVGTPPPSRSRAFGISLMLLTTAGVVAFLWWISRPDLRHPFWRLRRGEFWTSGQGGFGGDFGGFGGGTAGGGLK